LYYREIEFRETCGLPSSESVESLIAINIKLGNKDAAHGLLRSSASEFVKVRPSWYEKLENWNAALSGYSIKQLSDPKKVENFSGRLRCLSALGDWERLLSVTSNDPISDYEDQTLIFTGLACLNLQKWDFLAACILKFPASWKNFDALILIVASHIVQRTIPDNEILPMITSGYSLAENFVHEEQLKLLEDIITLNRDKKECQSKWNTRLLELDYSLDIWNRLVPLRALLLDPFTEDIDIWIRYSTLSRKKLNLTMSEKIVERLVNNPQCSQYHGVILSQIKNIYAAGDINGAIQLLEIFLKNPTKNCSPYLLSKCYNALGLWYSPSCADKVKAFLTRSVELNPTSYKSWSSLGLLKFRECHEFSSSGDAIEAIDALSKCISLFPQLQDILRFLSLWFSFYGKDDGVDEKFDSFFTTCPLNVWIQALPQIMARLRSRREKLRSSVRDLISRIGITYPQSVVFPLVVALQSAVAASGDKDTSSILEEILSVHPVLVMECKLVATELVRISTTWYEQWSVWLEEASRFFFVEKKREEMMRVLDTAHASIDRKPETPNERMFISEYGSSLFEARTLVLHSRSPKTSSEDSIFFLMQAWQIYYEIFQKIHKKPPMSKIDLDHVSPALFGLCNSALYIPSDTAATTSSNTDGSVVRIHSFSSRIDILTSKQRPRILNALGTDGRSYKYLLKGNEDLKQDERVMQLFKLVNSVIADSVASRRRSGVFPTTPGIESLENVTINRYAVVPLSNNAGLIEWVHGCETMHAIIKEERERKKIPLSIEHNLMRSVYTRYEELPIQNRISIFDSALLQTSGNEVRDSMILACNGNSAIWYQQRLLFSRTLAVTSIIGYILGLGDRHPSNLMIDRTSGQVVHIDFGDCFDVTMMRDKFPEKIPFRLTRQLVNAMEVAGLEGTFRITAERMIDLVRKNSDTIMAMLEAFIYDPLITWRLLPGASEISSSTAESLSTQAKQIVERVHAKISGRDNGCDEESIQTHVDRLIREATAHENLCSLYLGYCAFW